MTAARWSLGLVFSIILASAPPIARADSRSVTLATSDLTCITRHLKDYLDAADDPIVIVPGRCPDVAGALDAATLPAVNGPQITDRPRIVVLRKYELQCVVAGYKLLTAKARQKPSITWNLNGCRTK